VRGLFIERTTPLAPTKPNANSCHSEFVRLHTNRSTMAQGHLLPPGRLPGHYTGGEAMSASDEERGAALHWNARDLLVHEVVGEQTARFPDRTAVEVVTDTHLRDGAGPDAYTYSDIDAMASALALELRALGAAGREDDEMKVGVLVEEGVGLVVCELAVLKTGAAFVPLDPTWPSQRLGFILRDCHARAVLLSRAAGPAMRKKLQAAGLFQALDSTHTPSAGEAAPPPPDVDNRDAHAILALEWEWMLEKRRGCRLGLTGDGAGACGDGEGRGGDRSASHSGLPPPRGAAMRGQAHILKSPPMAVLYLTPARALISEDFCLFFQRCSHLIYTSGTSGQPKGVICEHRGLVNYMHAKARAHHLIPHAQAPAGGDGPEGREVRDKREGGVSRVLVTAAATWDPSLGDIFSTLGGGAVVCLAPRAALLTNFAQVLEVSRATHVCTTPALWDLLPGHYGPAHFPHLRVLALGGAPFPRHYLSRWCSASRARERERERQGGREAGRQGGREAGREGESLQPCAPDQGGEGAEEGGGAAGGARLLVLNTYGVTEATVYQTVYCVQASEGGEGGGGGGGRGSGQDGEGGGGGGGRGGGGGGVLRTVGQPLNGVLVEVEGDACRAGGVVGEILVGGLQVAPKP
jgi:acyl-CoA synthetase (AMP-forming)/AMP-acid ligase II